MNPKYRSALVEFEKGNPGPLLAIALHSRDDVCRCQAPELDGLALMCRECLHQNQDQVKRAEAAIRQHHPFQPGGMLGLCGRETGVGRLTCLRDEAHEWHQPPFVQGGSDD